MFLRLGGSVDYRDLKPYTFPELNSLKELNFESVCLGSFVQWDVPKQSEIIMKELGWCGDHVENVPPKYSYEKIECYMQGVRDYIKYIKRGYSRPSHLAALDLRAGNIEKSEAEEMIKLYEGKTPPSLEIFLEFIGLKEEEFYEIAMSHKVKPWEYKKLADNLGEKTADFKSWGREGHLDRATSLEMYSQWKKGKV